ncbi:alpha/beta hydrolase [Parvibaculum sp.]|uniref:alpha/beta hydrolase n=1 Tax=Parvibaculum sp. TaxID=2024848 RepID=UPI00273111B2|nr:phospholipase [Parvibaculum sp.]MDP1627896.1 phospholipase [Parvibaculum sp.]MDP2150894.1 phospholipase [Parvibaculum sp.]MDP3327409.1 phospholipase [Parvibaculum sp.]
MTLAALRRPAASGKAEWLVVFLHGYGSAGVALMSFADFWQGSMPNVAFVAPDGPTPAKDGGFQWIGKRPGTDPRLYDDAVEVAPALHAFIDAELARENLGPDRLALVGFSQGTVMTLHLGLRRAVAPAAVLGYSGGLVGADKLKNEITSKPPVMLVHGEQDALAPVYGMMASVKALAEAGIVCQGVPLPNLGHEVNADALIYGARFLLSAFAFRERHGLADPR